MIASVSEDATCKLWDSSDKPFDTLKGHQGKNVRAIATFSDQIHDIVATGGEDGAIKIWNITHMKSQKLRNQENKSFTLRLPLPDGSLSENQKDFNKIRSIEILKNSEYLVTTSRGSIFKIKKGQ